jgi:hypothetical protein
MLVGAQRERCFAPCLQISLSPDLLVYSTFPIAEEPRTEEVASTPTEESSLARNRGSREVVYVCFYHAGAGKERGQNRPPPVLPQNVDGLT